MIKRWCDNCRDFTPQLLVRRRWVCRECGKLTEKRGNLWQRIQDWFDGW